MNSVNLLNYLIGLYFGFSDYLPGRSPGSGGIVLLGIIQQFL